MVEMCSLGHQYYFANPGSYEYGDNTYPASSPSSGASFSKCRNDAIKALKADEPACAYEKCTFGGIWNGGGGAGQKNLYVASFFYSRASQVGFIDANLSVAEAKPRDFKAAAKHACKLSVEEAKATYSGVSENDIPYICIDLVYQYTLLVDGFGIEPSKEITLVDKVEYQNYEVEAAWPLGSAIEVASSPEYFTEHLHVMHAMS